jgi:uncharacterized protein (TIGR02246 family)
MIIYPTPEEAENAFYRAFENADLEAMMAIWADDEAIACVHPMGKVLQGREAVRESWRQIFGGDAAMRFEIDRRLNRCDESLAVHTVTETIYLRGESKSRPPIIATNIYKRTADGWRMVLHHASPSVLDVGADRPEPPRQLH